jgi:putative transposase
MQAARSHPRDPADTGSLAADPDPPEMPSERNFYRLVERIAAGKHTFGSARTRRSLGKQPDDPFAAVTTARPGELMQIDSTPLDVRVILDDGPTQS